VRALNATSRGLALILNRNMGVDVQKAIPWLQNPAAGAAGQPNQNEVPGEPGERHDGGGVDDEQRRAQGGHGETMRAHGGRVNAANIDHAPTEAQKKAGNYAKDHVSVHGLDIAIENAKGHARTGTDKGGKPWSVRMPAHYGYIKGTVGRDKDHVDVYLGPHTKSPHVFVVDQLNAETGKFDEHKSFLGFASKKQAVATYHKAFSDGKSHQRLGHVAEMTVDEFKHWLERGDTTKPVSHHEEHHAAA
jgi:inorganic pyrophosphatase